MQLPEDRYFTYNIKVTESDIDELGHVSNIVYVRWIQDASVAHWFSVITEKIRRDYVWVVVRHEVDYLQSALLHNEIVAYTWVGKHTKATSERFVKICNAVSGKCYVEAKTIWCLLSAKNMRPARIGEEIMEVLEK